MTLNENQQKAVDVQGHCLVTACPGAGKTRVLAHRAAKLLQSFPNGKLLASTFTKDAAKSLKNRILAEAGEEVANRLAVGTLHSLAYHQIKKANLLAKIASPGEQSLLMRRAAERTKEPIDYEDAVKAIEYYKSTMEAAPPPHTSPGAEAYHLYQEYLIQAGLQDFSDLIQLAVLGMRDGSVEPYLVQWLLVDEAQDLDEVQMAWVEAHTKHASTMLVADDDQSIYGWRHAMGYQGLVQFKNQAKADLVTLSTNYRCDQKIISAAAKLIQCNQHRVPKAIKGQSSNIGEVRAIQFKDRMVEAEAIVNDALRKPDDYNEFAVLARTNQLLSAVEIRLLSEGIPYYRATGKSIWDRESTGVLLGLLHSISSKTHGGLLTALHFACIPTTAVEDALSKSGNPYRKVLSMMENPQKRFVKPESKESEQITSLAKQYREWEGLLNKDKVSLVIAGVSKWVRSHLMSNDFENEICEHLTNVLLRLSGSLPKRLSVLKTPKKKEQNGVALMTLHASKGLEWNRVWLIGVEHETLPHEDSPIEEERRLCYVGMTRARNELNLSWIESAQLSPFLGEAGLIEQIKVKPDIDNAA